MKLLRLDSEAWIPLRISASGGFLPEEMPESSPSDQEVDGTGSGIGTSAGVGGRAGTGAEAGDWTRSAPCTKLSAFLTMRRRRRTGGESSASNGSDMVTRLKE